MKLEGLPWDFDANQGITRDASVAKHFRQTSELKLGCSPSRFSVSLCCSSGELKKCAGCKKKNEFSSEIAQGVISNINGAQSDSFFFKLQRGQSLQ